MPSDVILEGLYESKLQDSVQLQTVLALYEQEIIEPKEFGINFLRNETWWHWKYHETGRRSETRTADNNTDSKFYQESWYLESHASYWRSLFSKLYDCYRGIAFRKIPRPRWLSVLESQLQDRSVRKRIYSWTQYVVDQWSGDGRIFRRSCGVAVDWGAKRFRWFWNAWCEDFVCVEKNHLWCLEGSEKLQTLFATYNQELNRGQVAPTYQKLRKKWGNILIRRQGHAISKPEMKDMRIEGVLVKSRKEMSALQGRNGQCSKGDSWSFNQGSHASQGAHSFSSSKAATQTEGRKPCIFRSSRGASPSGLKGREGPFQNFLKGKCTESPRDLWHPPVCLNY